jgi:hypothetical protein
MAKQQDAGKPSPTKKNGMLGEDYLLYFNLRKNYYLTLLSWSQKKANNNEAKRLMYSPHLASVKLKICH